MTDCLIIGMNSQRFGDYLETVKSLGQGSGAYRDIRLSYIEYEGRPYQALDLLSELHRRNGGTRTIPFHNADFIWPTITYLGSYLDRRGLSFDYINAFQYEKEALRDKLAQGDVLAVAISTTLYVVPWPITEIIEFIRLHDSRVKIIVGGPYVANMAKSDDQAGLAQQLHTLGADYYVISAEGEATLARLLETLKAAGDPRTIDNLAYRDGDQMIFTRAAVERNPIEDNPIDYSLFSGEAIGQFVSTRTAKSCPFACAFCNFPQQAGKYTYISVDDIERELDAIRAIGTVTTLTFIDDTFNVPKKRFAEILRMMIRKDYARDFRWNCTLRSDHADDEIISLMAKAGCEGVFMGVESGSPKMLKAMNKTAKREDYLRTIPRLKEEGILAHANVFIGFPTETRETVEETLDLIRTTRPETFSAQPWYANPLTPVWKKREVYQIRGSSFQWSHATMDSATACDLVDHVFRTVDESIFLPQYGFFQWSLFYLQRQGMPIDRIKGYLRAFNALVREKIGGTVDPRAHGQLVANLEASSRFDDHATDSPEVHTLYSATARIDAERYCLETFPASPDLGVALRQSLGDDADQWHSRPVSLPAALSAQALPESARIDTVLAALAILLWRLDELRPVPLLVAAPDPTPLMLHPDSELPFDQWKHQVHEAYALARPHRLHAFDVLSGRSRLLPFHAAPIHLRSALVVASASDLAPLGSTPAADDLRLEIRLSPRSEPAALTMRGRCDPGVLAILGDRLSAMLLQACAHPEIPIAQLDGPPPAQPGATPSLAHERFSF